MCSVWALSSVRALLSSKTGFSSGVKFLGSADYSSTTKWLQVVSRGGGRSEEMYGICLRLDQALGGSD